MAILQGIISLLTRARPILPRCGHGENLNEHIVGLGWPETEMRQERLAEAIEVVRRAAGGNHSHHGRYFTVENARLYNLPAACRRSSSPRAARGARSWRAASAMA